MKAVISLNFGEITAFAPVAGCTGSAGSGCLIGPNLALGALLRESRDRRRPAPALSGGDLYHQRVSAMERGPRSERWAEPAFDRGEAAAMMTA
ncbi:hypothetical protein, partial [Methylorubrum podarium]|uniref:hypothetical protein n=1 Tax=Methylorubrum podarium TaxID=200476 RepID=UPI001EE35CA6